MWNVYSIEVEGIVRYIGMSKDVKRREKEHQRAHKLNAGKELYKNMHQYNPDENIVLNVLKTFRTKTDAARYEAYLILNDYWSGDEKNPERQLWQSPPRVIKYF